jgi:hypothetical protein
VTENETRLQLGRAKELLDRADRQSRYAAQILRQVRNDAATATLMLERCKSAIREDS